MLQLTEILVIVKYQKVSVRSSTVYTLIPPVIRFNTEIFLVLNNLADNFILSASCGFDRELLY